MEIMHLNFGLKRSLKCDPRTVQTSFQPANINVIYVMSKLLTEAEVSLSRMFRCGVFELISPFLLKKKNNNKNKTNKQAKLPV